MIKAIDAVGYSENVSNPSTDSNTPIRNGGGNTPGIIKVPFLRMTAQNPGATYACINLGEAVTLRGLEAQSILLDADIGAVLSDLK